jgi:glycosyltransferase involved in cell wall biosynthesis
VEEKKILFISYDGMSDPLGQSQVIPYLKGLRNYGYKIFLLSCEKKQLLKQNKTTIEALVAAANIIWIPISYTKNPPVLSTMLDIYKLKRAAKKIHQKYKLDMVHTRPGVPALVGLWMKRKCGVKFLNDIREFYADSRVDGNMWNLKNPLYKIIYNYFKKKEAVAITENDGIVCLTYTAEKIIKEWPEYNKNIPLEVIPCSVDLNLFNPDIIDKNKKELLRKELGITENDFIITYLGSIGGWYLTHEMLEFCKILGNRKPAAKFLFISPHRHDEIIAAAKAHQINTDKVVIKKASREEVPLLLSLSNFSVFFIKPCYSKQSSSPTKHGEIMAMGIPLITNSGVGDVEKIVNQYHSGIIIQQFNEKEYTGVAEKIAASFIFDKANIRNGAKDFFSLTSAIEKYNRIYQNILMQ